MQGGYNIHPLIEALDNETLAPIAAKALKHTLLMFDNFHDVEEKAKAGNAHAKPCMQSWADAEWYLTRPELAEKITVTVFKVTGETNTDDLSPAPDAWSRPDIPLHALAMLKNARDGIEPDQPGSVGPIKQIEAAEEERLPAGLRRRRGRHRFFAQIRHQLGAVVHGRRHPVRAEQARRRRVPGRQDRADLLQHHGRCRRPADRGGRVQAGHGRRDRRLPVQRRSAQPRNRRADRQLRAEDRRAARRSARRRPYPADHRPRPDHQGARSAGPAAQRRVPPRRKPVADSGKGFSLAQKMVGRACGVAGARACARAPTANRR